MNGGRQVGEVLLSYIAICRKILLIRSWKSTLVFADRVSNITGPRDEFFQKLIEASDWLFRKWNRGIKKESECQRFRMDSKLFRSNLRKERLTYAREKGFKWLYRSTQEPRRDKVWK